MSIGVNETGEPLTLESSVTVKFIVEKLQAYANTLLLEHNDKDAYNGINEALDAVFGPTNVPEWEVALVNEGELEMEALHTLIRHINSNMRETEIDVEWYTRGPVEQETEEIIQELDNAKVQTVQG